MRYVSTGHRVARAGGIRYASTGNHAPVRCVSTGHRIAHAMPVPGIAYIVMYYAISVPHIA
eukprot:3604468-Rhodomonas_salina.1